MIDLTISTIIGYAVICWFTGFCVGKTWAFIQAIFQRATGTY